jgi:hypothetical protein
MFPFIGVILTEIILPGDGPDERKYVGENNT